MIIKPRYNYIGVFFQSKEITKGHTPGRHGVVVVLVTGMMGA